MVCNNRNHWVYRFHGLENTRYSEFRKWTNSINAVIPNEPGPQDAEDLKTDVSIAPRKY
jgi:hypothetical protein